MYCVNNNVNCQDYVAPPIHKLFTTNPTWPALSLNTELCCERPTTESPRNNTEFGIYAWYWPSSLLTPEASHQMKDSQQHGAVLGRNESWQGRKEACGLVLVSREEERRLPREPDLWHPPNKDFHPCYRLRSRLSGCSMSFTSENLLLIPAHQITPEPFPAEMVVFRQNITAIISRLHKYYSNKLLFLLPAKAPSHCCVTHKVGCPWWPTGQSPAVAGTQQGAWSRQG